MNDVSSAILDMDRSSYFTCLFNGFVSSYFRIVVNLSLLDYDTQPLQPTSIHVNSDDICLSSMC